MAKKKNKMGVGTGLAMGAVASMLEGLALASGVLDPTEEGVVEPLPRWWALLRFTACQYRRDLGDEEHSAASPHPAPVVFFPNGFLFPWPPLGSLSLRSGPLSLQGTGLCQRVQQDLLKLDVQTKADRTL
ncbi:hypothetical protein E2562_003397 [Oryza meyeriana var. granulata]|uniref:Uncharacterized protein n=1 Tax=Oryza meyeriana var. granulata TaxID=110450 RepID=A0A6G1EF20_9ORYZ|nr:hypothetical protein E2562_003397 [Oryza meyeriana var. granulata]